MKGAAKETLRWRRTGLADASAAQARVLVELKVHHHGVTGEKSTVLHELTLFAKEVARKIET